jgi:hypothetical protein
MVRPSFLRGRADRRRCRSSDEGSSRPVETLSRCTIDEEEPPEWRFTSDAPRGCRSRCEPPVWLWWSYCLVPAKSPAPVTARQQRRRGCRVHYPARRRRCPAPPGRWDATRPGPHPRPHRRNRAPLGHRHARMPRRRPRAQRNRPRTPHRPPRPRRNQAPPGRGYEPRPPRRPRPRRNQVPPSQRHARRPPRRVPPLPRRRRPRRRSSPRRPSRPARPPGCGGCWRRQHSRSRWPFRSLCGRAGAGRGGLTWRPPRKR